MKRSPKQQVLWQVKTNFYLPDNRTEYANVLKADVISDRTEDQVRNLQKKLQSLEGQYDSCSENLFSANVKLEEKEKVFANAEADVGNLSRRILLIEDEVQRSEERLGKAVKDLCQESKRADDTIRSRQQLEQAQSVNEESIDTIEGQLKEAKFMLAGKESVIHGNQQSIENRLFFHCHVTVA